MTLSAANGSVFIFRTATNSATDGAFAAGAAPLWVKLIRSGSLFTGYQSTNGSTWTQIGSQSISMGSTIYVGLAVTSKNLAALSTATFSDVTIIGTSSAAPATVQTQSLTASPTTFSTTPITTTTTKKKSLVDGLV
jgi:hypothetical protein